jgi:Tol biopolymer transport system component
MNLKRNTQILIMVTINIFVGRQAHADFVFGEPENLGPVINSTSDQGEFDMSFDGLELYFGSDRPGGVGDWDIWFATRATPDDDWGVPVNLGNKVNGSKDDWAPSISADKLSLYFSSDRPGNRGYWDLWVTTRASVSDPWGAPVNLGPTVNVSPGSQIHPSISADELSLYFGSNREKRGTPYSDLCYIYVTTRVTTNDSWSEPLRLGPAVNPGIEYDSDWPSISEDGLSLFFSRWTSDGAALQVATRTSVSDSWNRSVSLGLFGVCPCFSPDGSTIYFCSGKYGGYGVHDLLTVSIEPVVDLNGDGIVDAADMCIIVENWGTDNSLCDIGPMPWGDGVVDVEDLIVLAEHLFEEYPPVEPVE